MSTETRELVEIVLRDCDSVSPDPWYPSEFIGSTGVSRERLDPILDELRLGGLIELTPWVTGKGQGYVVTETGALVASSPRLLDRVRRKGVPMQTEQPRYTAPSGPESTWERGEAARNSLVNPGTPRATRTLLFVNIGVFLVGWAMAMQQGIGGEYMYGRGPQAALIQLKLGMLSRELVLFANQWWRIVACFFVHIGLLHIALNMYFLFVIGPMTEGMYGVGRFLLLYFFAGLGASYSALVFSEASMMAGASGALCGILAALPIWVMMNKKYLPPNLVSNWMRNIFINIFLIVFISFMPGVSAAGHFGGGIAGAIIAVPLVMSRFGRGPQRAFAAIGVVALVLALGGMFFQLRAAGQEAVDASRAQQAFNPAVQFLTEGDGGALYEMGSDRLKVDNARLEKARDEITKLLAPIDKFTDISARTDHGRATQNAAVAWSDALKMFQKSLNPKIPWTAKDEKRLGEVFKTASEMHVEWRKLKGVTADPERIKRNLNR